MSVMRVKLVYTIIYMFTLCINIIYVVQALENSHENSNVEGEKEDLDNEDEHTYLLYV